MSSRLRALSVFWCYAVAVCAATLVSAIATRAEQTNALPPSPEFFIEDVDAPHWTQGLSERALQLDSKGHPHVVYGGDHLYYAWHDGTRWQHEIVDPSPGTGADAALAFDRDGNPHISYRGSAGQVLNYASKTGHTWRVHVVDQGDPIAFLGVPSAPAIDAFSVPHIAYTKGATLTHASLVGDEWQHGTVAPWPVDGGRVSLALDSTGHPHLAFALRYPDQGIIYSRWTGTTWFSDKVVASCSSSTPSPSIAIDAADQPHIAFVGEGNKAIYAHPTGEGWKIEAVDESTYAVNLGIFLDHTGAPHISYKGYGAGFHHAFREEEGWQTEAVETTGSVEGSIAMALDALGCPHVAFYNYGAKSVEYATKALHSWHTERIADVNEVGIQSSLAMDSDGRAHIAYLAHGAYSRDLKYARWTGATWLSEVVDGYGDAGFEPCLALDSTDRPHIIFYRRYPDRALIYAQRAGTEWLTKTLEFGCTGDGYSEYASLALDAEDRPHIGCHSVDERAILYARLSEGTWITETVASGRGYAPSLALDASGAAHLVYRGDSLRIHYARRTGANWEVETLPWTGGGAILALGPGGLPRVIFGLYGQLQHAQRLESGWRVSDIQEGDAYSLVVDGDGRSQVAYASRAGEAEELRYAQQVGSAWLIQTVANVGKKDVSESLSTRTSIALGRDHNVHVSFYDYSARDLRIAYAARCHVFLPSVASVVAQ